MALLDDEARGLRRLFGRVEPLGLAVDLEPVVADLLLRRLARRGLRLLRLGFFTLISGLEAMSCVLLRVRCGRPARAVMLLHQGRDGRKSLDMAE